MISKRTALRLSIGIGALALGAVAPSVVGDGQLPAWLNVVHWARQNVASQWLSDTSRRIVASFDRPTPSEDTRAEADQQPGSGPAAAPEADFLDPQVLTDNVKALGLDPTGLREALAAYKAGNLAVGDAAARDAKDPIVRTALEWIALRSFAPHDTGFDRLQAFAQAHPDWPSLAWLRRRKEEALLGDRPGPSVLKAYFTTTRPETVTGKLALARILEIDGKTGEAASLVKTLWRDNDLGTALEAKIKADFGSYLDKADHKYRAERLLYKEQPAAALRAAALAGPDVLALAKVRIAVINEAANEKIFSTVPAALQSDPSYLFARIQYLRRADKIREAVAIMLSAPRDPQALVDGDDWWVERRLLARKLLDQGDAKTAYKLCNESAAASRELKIEAAFHAGWIALRFLNDAALAQPHFAAAAALAETPMSMARAAYWQGRAVEASTADDATERAHAFYEKAAAQPSTYYGQLALARLNQPLVPDRAAATEATGAARDEAVRVIELFYALGERELGVTLAVETAQTLKNEAQVAALASVIDKERDAHFSLVVGKLLTHRGMPVDNLSYPTYGIPLFEPLQNSAAKSVVYSVARQESAFDPKAVSSAGAKGLMQMIVPTARRTAERAGLAFDETRLLSDAAFNAQLGAAHLGALLNEQGGSYILAFAAYNAGGRRVKQWIDAYGDPRTPGVDPIDWVERIPFTETRNYVQRCVENLAMYKARFGEGSMAGREGDPRVQAKL